MVDSQGSDHPDPQRRHGLQRNSYGSQGVSQQAATQWYLAQNNETVICKITKRFNCCSCNNFCPIVMRKPCRVSAPSCWKLACKLVVQSHEDAHEQPVENCIYGIVTKKKRKLLNNTCKQHQRGAECGSHATNQQDMDRVNTT